MEAYFEQRISVDYTQFNDKDILIVGSLFTCDNAYNKYIEYVKGLETLMVRFKRNVPNAKFLIFYDNLSDELRMLQTQFSKVFLIKFDFPEFKQGDNHIGMFGTLVRYLPMFLTKFRYNYLHILDVDVPNSFIPDVKVRTLTNFMRTGDNLHILTIPSAPINPRFTGMDTNLNTWVRIIGEGIILKKIKFPVEILYNFLHIYLLSDVYEEQYQAIFRENSKHERKLKEEHGKFMYGVDECMLVFLMQYIEQNKMPFRYTITPYHYKLPFYYWLENEATDELQAKLNQALGCDGIMEFVGRYSYKNREILFKTLMEKVDMTEYFSPLVCGCIRRESTMLGYLYSIPYTF